jgi:hypothetical protein
MHTDREVKLYMDGGYSSASRKVTSARSPMLQIYIRKLPIFVARQIGFVSHHGCGEELIGGTSRFSRKG